MVAPGRPPPQLLLLLLFRATGLAVPRELGKNCSCLSWKEAYYAYNVTCGQGLERYADTLTLGNLTLAAQQHDPVVRLYAQSEVCRHLWKRMDFSHAMNTRLALMGMPEFPLEQRKVNLTELSHPKTWCYVKESKLCKTPRENHVPNTRVSVQVFAPDDASAAPALRDLSMDAILELAAMYTLDLAALLPNGGYVMPPGGRWDPQAITQDDMAQAKGTGKPTMLMSTEPQQHRLYVQGDRVVHFRPGWPQGATAHAVSW
mmetsp:Transcript_55701/g.129718  ORF Transcript_55701/g.129718 Transcript_55701/m.129718 type:complete len:259 (-) Transcript_55701:75-851(-)